jgi:hypothetical protein
MIENKVLLIVPTRNRSHKILDFYKYFSENSSITTLCLGLDADDYLTYPKIDGVITEVNERSSMNGTLNFIAKKYCNDYDYIAFMGDDHRIMTKDWDRAFVSRAESVKNSIVYGDDLLQGEFLPTAVMVDSNIIRTLGYMAPPNQTHLYIDNFWKQLGEQLGTLIYVKDVVIEHMHPLAGKSAVDQMYIDVNSPEKYESDGLAYQQYMDSQFQVDVEKLKTSNIS